MNKKLFLIPIILGIAAVISLSVTFVSEESSESQSQSIYDGGFTYYDIETIQTTLAEQNITVSTPVAITDHTVSQYCTFFENQLPKTVDYCTTTNVLDSEGKTLGNINMGGDTNSPILAIANLETTNLESNQDDVLSVIEVMIETLVCDCWEEEKSDDDLESISAWVDAVYNFYNDSGQRNVKSRVDDLGTSVITLEVTSKENSILQTLIIQK
jgi:hypothetical protein